MSSNSLSVLTARLNPIAQQRLLEFLDAVDTDTAARFRGWLGTASEAEVSAAAESLRRVSHGRDFLGWWRGHDSMPAGGTGMSEPVIAAYTRHGMPVDRRHSRTDDRRGSRDLTVGGAWLAGGLLVTIGTYSLAATSPGGGQYFIAYGAILYGLFRLLRGLTAR